MPYVCEPITRQLAIPLMSNILEKDTDLVEINTVHTKIERTRNLRAEVEAYLLSLDHQQ